MTKIEWQQRGFGAFLTVRNLCDVQKPTQSYLDLDGHLRGAMSDPRTIGISFEGPF